MNNRKLVQGALLLALAVVLQSLRLVIPLPPLFSTFLIGTLVNMMLIVTCRISGLKAAVLLTLLLPFFAYLQGQLPIPMLIPVVFCGNLLFVLLLQRKKSILLSCVLPPMVKAACMYLSARAVLLWLHIPEGLLTDNILFAMSVPQFITGSAGVLAAERLLTKLKSSY